VKPAQKIGAAASSASPAGTSVQPVAQASISSAWPPPRLIQDWYSGQYPTRSSWQKPAAPAAALRPAHADAARGPKPRDAGSHLHDLADRRSWPEDQRQRHRHDAVLDVQIAVPHRPLARIRTSTLTGLGLVGRGRLLRSSTVF